MAYGTQLLKKKIENEEKTCNQKMKNYIFKNVRKKYFIFHNIFM